MRHDVIWTQISVGMKEFNHELNWKQCKSHMSSLKKKFNEEYKDTKKTGAAPSTWEHFAAMLEIFGGTPTLDAPYLVSAGMVLTSLAMGKPEDNVERNTRTRPQSHRSSSTSALNKSNKTTKYSSKTTKTTKQEIDDRRFNQTERMITVVDKIRDTIEKNGAIRKLVYKELLGKQNPAIVAMIEAQEKEKVAAEDSDEEDFKALTGDD